MDLSILPDDQLLQLIEAVTKEVARRAIAIQAATHKYWQEAKEEILENINDRQAPIDDDLRDFQVKNHSSFNSGL